MPAAPSQRSALIVIVLVAMTAAVYWQTGDHPFFLVDDGEYVQENPVVLEGLTLRGVDWAFTSFHAANWHPLAWISHMADVEVFGPDPGRHHLVNVLIHGLNALLLFLVLHGMTGAPWRSALVAALFAVHPLHVESVAWVAERKDLLCAFFGFLTIGAYTRYVRKPAVGRYAALLLSYVLCLLSKPMLVTLPVLLLLLDYWPLGRLFPTDCPRTARASGWLLPRVVEKIPLFLLSAASCILTLVAQGSAGAVTSLTRFPLGLRVGNAVVSYAGYLLGAVWPSPLAVYYPFPAGGIPAWKVAGACALLAVATLMVFLRGRNRPWLVTGWLWYLGALVPVIGLVQVGEQAMVDRYTYLPLIGLFLVIAWEGGEVLPGWRFRRQALGIAAAAILAVLSAAAWVQVGYWTNSTTLIRHTLSVTRDNWMAWNVLGIFHGREGRHS